MTRSVRGEAAIWTPLRFRRDYLTLHRDPTSRMCWIDEARVLWLLRTPLNRLPNWFHGLATNETRNKVTDRSCRRGQVARDGAATGRVGRGVRRPLIIPLKNRVGVDLVSRGSSVRSSSVGGNAAVLSAPRALERRIVSRILGDERKETFLPSFSRTKRNAHERAPCLSDAGWARRSGTRIARGKSPSAAAARRSARRRGVSK